MDGFLESDLHYYNEFCNFSHKFLIYFRLSEVQTIFVYLFLKYNSVNISNVRYISSWFAMRKPTISWESCTNGSWNRLRCETKSIFNIFLFQSLPFHFTYLDLFSGKSSFFFICPIKLIHIIKMKINVYFFTSFVKIKNFQWINFTVVSQKFFTIEIFVLNHNKFQ